MTAEFDLIAAIEASLDHDRAADGVIVGTGDDAAVVDVDGTSIVIAVDTLVDGVHVDRRWSSLDDVGWKALAVNVSDVAAVGGTPVAAVVSLQRPDGFTASDARALYGGLRAAADRWGCRLVGGDTVGAPVLSVSVTVIGRPLVRGVALRRGAAVVGDAVVVVGALGLAAAGLDLHRAAVAGGAAAGRARAVLDDHPTLSAAHRRPRPPVDAAAVLVEHGVRAAIDVSDGLGRDLGHVATASDVSIVVRPDRLPVDDGLRAAGAALGRAPEQWVYGGGDDYALAATVPPEHLDDVVAAVTGRGHPVAVVGEVVAAGRAAVTTPSGTDLTARGWEHA